MTSLLDIRKTATGAGAAPAPSSLHQASADAPRAVTVLGCTGSVGRNTIELITEGGSAYTVEALTAGRNVALLAEQARALKPKLAVIADASCYGALKDALGGTGIELAAGAEAVTAAAERPADWVMSAIVGAAGLEPTLAAARRGATIAFANKETLVCAGPLMMALVRDCGCTLLPVDSEHSAIFQVFDAALRRRVRRLLLTASGGPFRTASRETMRLATPEQAVAHPVWSMGAKISVDSATMINKGLEIIEASYLFGMPEDKIDVLIHPQSVVHSMVEYTDGSVLAQMGTPDMRTPIAVALAWPDRVPTSAPRLDLLTSPALTFEAPDPERFPGLGLARAALKTGGSAPTILSAANEVAVAGFLERKLGFLDIERIVEETLSALPHTKLNDLTDVRDVDANARRVASDLVSRCSLPTEGTQ